MPDNIYKELGLLTSGSKTERDTNARFREMGFSGTFCYLSLYIIVIAINLVEIGSPKQHHPNALSFYKGLGG